MAESANKGLIVKIAVGVFLGVMAALIVYSLPGWYRKHEAEEQADRKTELEDQVLSLTPKKLIAVCGKPQKDVQNTKEEPFFRALTYNVKGNSVEVDFLGVIPTGSRKIMWTIDSYSGQFEKPGTYDWALDLTTFWLPCALRGFERDGEGGPGVILSGDVTAKSTSRP